MIYIIFNIIIPLIVVFIMPIVLFILFYNYFELSEINILFLTLEAKADINIPQWLSETCTAIFLCILAIFVLNIIRKLNENKEFYRGNLYGSNNYWIYRLAKFLGFSKISLKRKPYYAMFKIVMNGDFDLIDLAKENENLSSEIKIDVNYNNFHKDVKNNLKECNLIIADTYDINQTQLPESKQGKDTIKIERIGHRGTRISSDELVNKTREAILTINATGAKINLFLTTSTYNTYEIIEQCFMVGKRDEMNVTVFQQDTKDKNKNFKERGKKVLERKKKDE